MRRAPLVVITLCLCFHVIADGVVVDYYQGDGQSLGIAHSLVVSGDGDRNGPGSGVVEVEGVPAHVPDGIPDGVEGSLFEYCYDHAEAPRHAEAVAAWEQNLEAMWQLAGPHEGGAYAWGWDAPWSDGGSVPPYSFPEGDTEYNALNVRNTFYITVNEYSFVAGNTYWLLANWFFPSNPERRGEAYDFDSDPNFTRAMAAYFGSLGDLDGDGLTNLAEWNKVLAEWRALHGLSPDPEQDPADWPNEVNSRAEKDEIIGMYIDAATTASGLEIVVQPKSPGWLEVGDSFSLSVEVSGGGTPSFKWFHDDAEEDGAASATFSIPSAELDDAGVYVCEVTDGVTTLTTVPVQVDVFESLPVSGLAVQAVLVMTFLAIGVWVFHRRTGRTSV